MNHWNTTTKQFETNPAIDLFLKDLVAVCCKHSLSLSHEDTQGAFRVVPLNEEDINTLFQAHNSTGK